MSHERFTEFRKTIVCIDECDKTISFLDKCRGNDITEGYFANLDQFEKRIGIDFIFCMRYESLGHFLEESAYNLKIDAEKVYCI